MIARYLTALAGASVITIAILLGMNQVAKKFEERDAMRYFGITDFVALPESRRPEPPPPPAVPPDRPQIDVRPSGDSTLPVRIPSVDTDRVAPPPLIPSPDAADRSYGPAEER